MSKGYATTTEVLARIPSPTAEQTAAAEPALSLAEQLVDAHTGRQWMETVSGEAYWAYGPLIRLRQAPVSAAGPISFLNGLTLGEYDPSMYALLNAERGLVAWNGGTGWVRIAYVSGPPPDRVKEATIRAAVAWLQIAASPGDAGAGPTAGVLNPALVKSYSIGGALSVTYRDEGVQTTQSTGLPPDAIALLNGLRRVIVA